MLARAGDPRLADGQAVAVDRLRLEPAVEEFVLAIDDGVIERDAVEQHVIGVGNSGGRQNDEAGILRVDTLHALAVEGARAGCAAGWQAHRDRDRHPGPIEMRGRLVDDLVESQRGEIRELHFHDRAHALDGRAHRHADHGILGDRCVEHAVGKLHGESLRRLEGTAESRDVLAVEEDPVVLAQELFLGLTDGVDVGYAHCWM